MFQQMYLAQNIRTHRKLCGLTQAQLAEKLFVTAQNVSKWETGKSIPDLDNLCKLAKAFRISTDRLLGYAEQPPQGRLLIAIDGGGTKTEFVLYTEFGDILERRQLGGSNPNTVGMSNAQALLRAGIDQLMTVNPDIRAGYAGIAGCGIRDNQRRLQSFLKKTYPGIRWSVASDVPNVIYSAPVEERCIAVICGTGCVVYAKTPDSANRVGGWGYLWESGCSGYDFGRDALKAVLSAQDGIGPQTCLTEMIEPRLGGNIWENIGQIYQLHQEEIAAFSATVFEAYHQGDRVAAQIIEKNTEQLAVWINAAADRYDCGSDVVIAGGLTSQKTVLAPFLSRKLTPGLNLIFNDLPQICGAAVGGCRLLGEVQPGFKETFYKNHTIITEDLNHAEN